MSSRTIITLFKLQNGVRGAGFNVAEAAEPGQCASAYMDDRTSKDRDDIWVSKQVWRDLTNRKIRDDVALMSIPPTVHDRVALEEQEQNAEEEAITAKSNITKTGLAADSCPRIMLGTVPYCCAALR